MTTLADHVPGAQVAGLRRMFLLNAEIVDFERRGFRCEPAATRGVLEAAAGAFVAGYNAEVAAAKRPPGFAEVAEHHRGFQVEGAAMAAALLDAIGMTGGRRLAALRRLHGQRYDYLIHVGTGWARAKLHRSRIGHWADDEPLLRWLSYDGVGFCRTFFATPRRLSGWYRHAGACSATCHIQYQGLGRSLWFRECGSAEHLAANVARLPEAHRGDAWSGVGLAAAYAVGVPTSVLRDLRSGAGRHVTDLAQGAAFAAEAWRAAGSVPEPARTAIELLTGVDAATAAAWTWTARRRLDEPGAGAQAYQQWRERIALLAADHMAR